jgi:hypothetical protein
MRKIKAFIDVLLKTCVSKHFFKEKNIEKVNYAYLKTFKNAFLGHLAADLQEDFVNNYLHFIVIAFPKPKIEGILKKLMQEGSISQLDVNNFLSQVKLRAKTTKSGYRAHYTTNPCFQVLVDKVHEDAQNAKLTSLAQTLARIM